MLNEATHLAKLAARMADNDENEHKFQNEQRARLQGGVPGALPSDTGPPNETYVFMTIVPEFLTSKAR